MSQGVPRAILTHAQRVCRLYKKALRTMENHMTERVHVRYNAVLLRQRFEETRKEKDMRKLAAMLEEGEEECFEYTHLQPFTFKNDPGGIMFDRVAEPPDSVLDNWHPWEKIQFKDYFETREKRKAEYEKYFDNHILKRRIGFEEGSQYPAEDAVVKKG